MNLLDAIADMLDFRNQKHDLQLRGIGQESPDSQDDDAVCGYE